MLKILWIAFYCSLLFCDSATDICKKNFDDQIKRELTIKENLTDLISFCNTQQGEIRNAYKRVDEYEQEILSITKHNLIKSTLKLGYAVYQELSPLDGVEGKLSEISSWIISKTVTDPIQNEVIDILGLTPKDYYSVDLKILSDDLSKLTPEVEKLNLMRKAGLEAFEVKVQMETNQTVGEIGALYAKLRSLAEQSEIAKRSLYAFYKRLEKTSKASQSHISQIDKIIDAYEKAKDRTCVEQSSPPPSPEVEVTLEDVADFNEKTFSPDESCSSDRKTELENQLNTLENEDQKLFQTLLDTFNADLAQIDKAVWEKQENAKIDTIYKPDPLGTLDPYSVERCNLPGNIEEAYGKTIAYWNDVVKYEEEYIDILKTTSDEYDAFYTSLKTKYGDELSQIEDKITSANKLLPTYNETCTGDKKFFNFLSGNDFLYIAKTSIEDKKRPFLEYIQKMEKEKSDSKEIQNVIVSWYMDAQKCVQMDMDDLDIIMPQVNELLNYLDEKEMATRNLLDYLYNLSSKGISKASYDYEEGIKTLYAQFLINKDPNNYFSKLYNDFSGDDIEYLTKLQEILKPINTDILSLKSFIDEKEFLISFTEDNLHQDGAYGFLSRGSHPLENIPEAETLKTLLDKISQKEMEKTYINEDISKFSDEIISGQIPYIFYPDPFKKVADNIASRWKQLTLQLQVPSMSANTDLKWYKEILEGVVNFSYKAQESIDTNFLGNINDIVDSNITHLKDLAYQELPSEEAKTYDLSEGYNKCKDSLITLSTDKDSINIFGDESASIILTYDSCDGRKITISAELNQSEEGINITKSDDKIFLQSLGEYKGDINLILKAQDEYSNEVVKTVPIHLIPSVKNISLKKGWHLINGGFDASNLDQSIVAAWSYKDGVWRANSPYLSIKEELARLDLLKNIKKLYFIPQTLGTWVYAKEDTIIKTDNSPTDNIVATNLGWSLLGSSSAIDSPKEITCKDSVMDVLWIYLSDSNQWKLYYKDHINDIKSIEPNSGFWIHCTKDSQ